MSNFPAWILRGIAGLVVTCLSLSAGESQPTIAADEPWLDTQGQEIQAQGGSVVQLDTRFLWYGLAFAAGGTATEVRCYSSTDLATWTLAGKVLGDPVGRHVGALVDGHGGRTRLFLRDQGSLRIYQAPAPTGPFTRSGSPALPGAVGDGDAGVFAEGDGSTWVAYTVPMDAASGATLRIAPLAADGSIGGPPVALPGSTGRGMRISLDSPALWKRNDLYYVTAAEAGGWSSASTYVTTAKALAGPWTPWTKITRSMVCPGMLAFDTYNSRHNTVCEVRGAQGSLFVSWGDRWSQFTGYGQGKYVIMPLDFDGDSVGMTWYRPWHPDVAQGTFTQELKRFALWREPVKKKAP